MPTALQLEQHMLYRVESYKERWHAFGLGDADPYEHFSDDDADFPHGCDFDAWAGGDWDAECSEAADAATADVSEA